MKKNIFAIVFILIMGAGPILADEIVLENGKIYSGNVLNLTENTVSVLVNDKEIIIDRKDLQAVFLGEQTPFSSNGYPGMRLEKPIAQHDVQKDDKEKK